MHLAQINIARMLAPLDSPVMADFVDNLDRINTIAESSPGFVWRLKDEEENDATSINVYEDDYLIVNMSVWESMDALFQYTYESDHVNIFTRRKEWFQRMQEMHMALWFVEPGAFPTAMDGKLRLEYLRKHGNTPYAFSFRNKFTIADLKKYQPIL